ncbi:MIP/aquaporin family protein [Egicoccus halophilus]|uniref:Glycerol transporter n=1 Tax=Egicoccus halophilus TaxID=1670830 RepID=A0A8J3AC48_9ACTN|nr:MIP/aquaporin family protein [Egicoccus halophilus]GGI03253.1 glycerol transporter [Egicoccus halophilus]
MPTPLTTVFVSEVLATGVLMLLGTGVVANVTLARTKGEADDGGYPLVVFGWGIAVFVAVFVGFASGAHLNPAITFGLLASGAQEYADGVPVTMVATVVYLAAEVLGAFLGAAVAWLVYRDHFAATRRPQGVLGVFATEPAIRNLPRNLVTEIVATFVLVYVVLVFGNTPHELGPLPVALLVVGIGAGLGGPTGYAINPARDLGPRVAHAVLPIPRKGGSDWGYAWVPIVGPLLGAGVAGLASRAVGQGVG